MRAMVSIGDYNFPAPSEYQANTGTVVNEARNLDAVFIGSVVRDDVAKASLKWNFISASDWAELLSKFSIKRGGHFVNTVTLFLQDINDWDEREMYVSDRTASVFLRNPDGSIRGYTGATLSLTEV